MSEDLTTNNQLIYELDSEGIYSLNRLSTWSNVIGILNIVMGVFSLLTIFVDYQNFFAVLFSILFSILIIYVGTRLTSAASHIKYSVQTIDSTAFKTGLDNLKQYLFITGILYIVGIIFIIIAFAAIAGLGISPEDLS